MDLSIVVFDLRDAIEELREERAELLKRIEALEASALFEGKKPAESVLAEDEEQDCEKDEEERYREPHAMAACPLKPPQKSESDESNESEPQEYADHQLHSASLPEGGAR